MVLLCNGDEEKAIINNVKRKSPKLFSFPSLSKERDPRDAGPVLFYKPINNLCIFNFNRPLAKKYGNKALIVSFLCPVNMLFMVTGLYKL